MAQPLKVRLTTKKRKRKITNIFSKIIYIQVTLYRLISLYLKIYIYKYKYNKNQLKKEAIDLKEQGGVCI